MIRKIPYYKLLLFILLIVGCDLLQEEDCAGVAGGTAELDNCNVCDADKTNDCVPDCAGIWGGDAVEDCFGVCSGVASIDSCGICTGGTTGLEVDYLKDECGVCGGTNSTCTQDCASVWGGNHECGTVTDIDGNEYQTIIYGAQEWMVENLNTTRFSNGNSLQSGFKGENESRTEPSYFNYNNEVTNTEIYGRLYNWFAVEDLTIIINDDPIVDGSRNICPTGWHVPSKYECEILINYLGGKSATGKEFQDIGTEYLGGTSDAFQDKYHSLDLYGHYWTSTIDLLEGQSEYPPYNYLYAWELSFCSDCPVALTGGRIRRGSSIRCLKD